MTLEHLKNRIGKRIKDNRREESVSWPMAYSRWPGQREMGSSQHSLARAKSYKLSANRRGARSPHDKRSERRRTGDAWASRAEEGRGTLRKAPGSRVRAESRRCPNGETRAVKSGTSRKRREPGEVKHLSTLRKRNDSASSGERKRRSPNRVLRHTG